MNKKECNFPIDFVIPWVDGADLEWKKSFNQYCPKEKQKLIDLSDERYRDYGLLKYWFRGVEKFAPYVRKVHFITNGQKPAWLNIKLGKTFRLFTCGLPSCIFLTSNRNVYA